MTQRAMLCPRCRQLIGSDEATCSWCGTSRRAPWWKIMSWTREALTGNWLIKAVITANIAYYALSLMVSSSGAGSVGLLGFMAPSQTSLLLLGATGTVPIDHYGRIWTIITANYLHGGILHIIFNLMALRQIGPWVASEYGPSRMFIIYSLGGAFGFWVSYLAGVPFTIGASASVCSLIGALLYFGRSRGGVYGGSVYREVSGWVVSLVIFGLIMPGINNWGHGGGILGGIILGRLLGYDDRRAESKTYGALALLCALATAVLLCWSAISALMF